MIFCGFVRLMHFCCTFAIWYLIYPCTFAIGACVDSYDAISAAHPVKAKLVSCLQGVQTLESHERDLFRMKILQEGQLGCPGRWELLQLEEVLLQMAAEKDVTQGIIYMYGVPTTEGKWVVRSVCLSVCPELR